MLLHFLEYLDYIPSEEVLLIPSGQMESCTHIAVIDDDVVEYNESFVVTINSSNRNVFLLKRNVEVTILSDVNDGKPIIQQIKSH